MESYSEVQKFRATWFWALIVGLFLFIGYLFFKHIIMGEPFKGEPVPTYNLTVKLATVVGIGVLFLVLKLTIKADDKGLHYRMIPVHFKLKTIPWDEVASATVTDIADAKGFSAWGLSFIGKKNPSFIISGASAVIVHLKSEKKILLGTKRGEELKATIQKNISA